MKIILRSQCMEEMSIKLMIVKCAVEKESAVLN